MRANLVAAACACILSSASCGAQSDMVAKANQLELQGDFTEAAAILARALEDPSRAPAQRKQLEFDLDRLARIRRDFPFTQPALFALLKESVQGLTIAEYEQWIAEGRFDTRVIDGQRRFMTSSVPNLFFRYPELNPRRRPPKTTAVQERRHWETCAVIKEAALAAGLPFVLPKHFHARMRVTVEPNSAPAGEPIRAWLPIPRRYPYQNGFELLSTSSPVRHLDGEQSSIRSVFLEQPAQRNRQTIFNTEYRFTAYSVWFNPKPDRVQPCDATDAGLKEFLAEAPHVQFTPELRALSQAIVAGETNAFLIAKRCYDWIAEHILYSYAIEYSTIPNISDYCRSRGYGDCGQEALLFIALCRLNGIPARWQSGWNLFPAEKTIHDWSEVYLAPYGWMPVDPYMGVYAMRYATTLSPAQRREIRDFYFGGLDAYRMSANSDHNQTLNPPKETMRSDDVDFQRGELEAGGRNIYFNRYSWDLEVEEIQLPPRDD